MDLVPFLNWSFIRVPQPAWVWHFNGGIFVSNSCPWQNLAIFLHAERGRIATCHTKVVMYSETTEKSFCTLCWTKPKKQMNSTFTCESMHEMATFSLYFSCNLTINSCPFNPKTWAVQPDSFQLFPFYFQRAGVVSEWTCCVYVVLRSERWPQLFPDAYVMPFVPLCNPPRGKTSGPFLNREIEYKSRVCSSGQLPLTSCSSETISHRIWTVNHRSCWVWIPAGCFTLSRASEGPPGH